jgi:hypothetical protein
MPDEMKRYVCIPSGQGLRTLTFRDGCRISVMGLAEILEAAYGEGKQANPETVEEILEGLAATNYVPWSAREEYRELLMEEYRRFLESRRGETGQG